ncbi:hypothetical protein ASZ78_008312 [Callipepla squamata]|uniref:PLD-like domain-containing protein n=1 Tax=Callipepla squamata TaxID=9009 RepID=A0A226MVZ0_CALSU|nr:hypothetical protein ASZ78_008312 [Callipepla squamata]
MIVRRALKASPMVNESSNMKLRVNNQKNVKMFQISGVILMLGFVALMAVYFMRADSTADRKGEETSVSVYQEMEDEELYGDLQRTTVTEEDTNRSNDPCRFELVESVPYDLPFEINSTAAKPLYHAWMNLLDIAQEEIHVASYYWSLTGKDINVNDSSSKQGEEILKRFERLLAENVSVYIAASTPTLSMNSTDLELLERKEGRTHDLFAIISVISAAHKFVYVSVMDYFPTSRFVHPERYWPAIDNALRRVAFNYRVQVRLLVSCWTHTDPSMLHYLRSLSALNNPHTHISVSVPLLLYVGTSNWSEDYFTTTAGVGLIIKQSSTNLQRRQQPVQEQLKSIFERDWNSKYSVNVEDVQGQKDCNWRGRL